MTDATDKSMLRVSITSICPTATIISSAASIAIAVKFSPSIMRGLIKVTGITTATMAQTRPTSRCATMRRVRETTPSPSSAAGSRRPPPWIGAASASTSVAARMTRSASASARMKVAVWRPSRRTTIRSHMPMSSGSSDEMSRIASPCKASSAIIAWTSALLWTSTPWVGSSRIMSRGLAASHLDSTTFCWLPPESIFTGWSKLRNFSRNLCRCGSTRASSLRRRTRPANVALSIVGSEALARIGKSMTRLRPSRSSDT